MRRIAVALVVAGAWALLPVSTYADGELTAAVNQASIPHVESPALHDIAHQRAVEIVADFSHTLQRPGTGEVLGWNQGMTDPVGRVVQAWMESPVHRAILLRPDLREIGCARHDVGNISYFACVLGFGDSPPPVIPPPPAEQPAPSSLPGPALLPDTRTR